MSQARERARIEKIRKTNQLTERHRRMQQLLYDLPPQYLNNELRIMIAERAVETVGELIKIQGDARLERYLESDMQFLNELREKNPKFQAVPVTTEAKAKEVRGILEVLHNFIEIQHKNKRLDTNSAKKYSTQIKLAVCQSKADLFAGRAQQASKTKPRVAIHNYHSAIDAYKEFAGNPQAQKHISIYRQKIKALEAMANKDNEKFKEQTKDNKDASAAPKDEDAPQNKEWDKFMDKGDDWQIKNQYDD